MHLSPVQCKRFYNLFYSLLDYVNCTSNVLGEPFAPFAGDLGSKQVTTLVNYIFEENPDVIDRYLAANPDNLSASDLEQVDSWHEAFLGRFVLIEHKAAHSAFLSDGCVFNVIGLTADLSTVLRNAPTIAETVLLPFERYIVYGVNITEYSLDVEPEILDTLFAEYDRLLDAQCVATSAQEFIAEAPQCRQRRAEHIEIARQLKRELEDEQDDNLSAPSAGFHVGPLAGLDPEQRRAAIDEHFAGLLQDDCLARAFLSRVIPHTPVHTVAETLALSNKEGLCNLCRDHCISGFSKLKKAELVELLNTHFTALSAGAIIDKFARDLYANTLAIAKQVYDAGGCIEMTSAEYDALPFAERYRAILPLLNVFECDGTVSCVMPAEVMAAIAPGDWDFAIAEQQRIARLRHLASTYLSHCGIVSVEQLIELCLRYYPLDYDRQELCDFFSFGGPDELSRFDKWTFEGRTHLIDLELIGESETAPGLFSYANINGDKIDNPSDDEAFRRYLYDRHRTIDIWSLPSKSPAELEAYDYDEYVESLPSYLALRDFIDRNIPDGEDDYLFANRVLEQLVVMACLEYHPADILENLQSWGLGFDMGPKLNEMLQLLSAFFNEIPLWSNNGWSVTELEQRDLEQ